MPTTTSPTLLSRVRDVADAIAWREFDDRYGPLIVRFCRTRGLQHADAEDVRQLVMTRLARSLRGFRYAPERGRFRGYLGRIVHNEICRLRRCPSKVPDRVCPVEAVAGDWEDRWQREWVHHHLRLATERLRERCAPLTLEVFERLLAGAPVEVVAVQVGKSAAAVQKIKQRCRDRLRELVAEQVREEDGDHAGGAPTPRPEA